jgi:hypothetical protein
MGHYYFVDIATSREYWLLAIVLEAVLAPVNHPFVEAPQDDGSLLYVDTRCCTLDIVTVRHLEHDTDLCCGISSRCRTRILLACKCQRAVRMCVMQGVNAGTTS